MAKENEIQKPVVETKEKAPEKVVKTEVELKHGQVIIAPVDNPENEILTTLDDWNSLYNVGKNAGKFKLLTEKKS